MGHEHGKKIGWTVLLNLVITLAEYIGGTMSGSLALLADAGHNLSDVISLAIGYLGERLTEKKASKKHSFGFKRVEIFTALINALLLWAISVLIITEAFERASNPQAEISVWLMVGVGLIGLFGNLFSILILKDDKDSSLNMKAAYLHLFYDTISSVAVVVSGVIIYFTHIYYIDLAVSVLIGIMIFASGFGIIRKAVHILMQGLPEGVDFDEVYNGIKSVAGVSEVHSLHIWSINSNEIFLSCHIRIDGKVSKESDETIKRINDVLASRFGIEHTTIQLENAACSGSKVCGK
jgi:cobalt-zinc-cadmium efflux system protein